VQGPEFNPKFSPPKKEVQGSCPFLKWDLGDHKHFSRFCKTFIAECWRRINAEG
jgi:hypothetical protein